MLKEVQKSWTEVTVSDDTEMKLYCALPQGSKPNRGIMVFQEAFGVNSHIRDVTERFAREGFAAVSPDLFHRTATRFEGPYDDFNAVMPHAQALTPERLAADISATYNWLKQQVSADEIAAIGYCLGGRAAFVANSLFPLAGAISYYAGRMVPDYLPLAAKQNGDVLFFWGGQDKHILPEHIQAVTGAMKAAQKTYANVEFAGADHGFFCDERSQFNARAAEESWAMTLAFLSNRL